MPKYLNTNSSLILYNQLINSEYFVDKSGIIRTINKRIKTITKYICITKPRRFGKTSLLNMLGAYYCKAYDSKSIFDNLEISQNKDYTAHLNHYNVINMCLSHLSDLGNTYNDYIGLIKDSLKRDIAESYPELQSTVFNSVTDMLAATNDEFIFIIDEWDYIFSHNLYPENQSDFLEFLRDLLKDRPYVALAYMTGILPVKKYGQHSALNMFQEYSMTNQKKLEEYTGFTEEEVKELCERYEMDFVETSSWYDGYKFAEFQHIYNPKSVVESIRRHKLSSYWTSTETYEALKNYIDMDFDGLRSDIVQMLGGGSVKVNTRSFQNDMRNFKTKDDILTLLIHLGYLAYDANTQETFIPNKEIIGEFENAMSVGGWSNVMNVLKASEKLLEDTIQGHTELVAKELDRAHSEVASILTYNDENSLSCAIGLAYYSARKEYKLIRELPTGKGFADIVFLPLPHTNKPALIVELKYDKSVRAAIAQIKERQYTQVFETYTGEILLVGINYDKNKPDKPHSCVIEYVKKEE